MPDNSFLIGPTRQTERATIFDVPTTLGTYLSAERESSFESTYTRMAEQYLARPETGRLLTVDEMRESNAKMGITMSVPEEGMEYDKYMFNALRQIKLDSLERTKQRRPDGYASYILGTGAMLGPQILDPVGMVTNFIPVVGPARYAAIVGKTNTITGRTAARFGLGAGEGAVATAALEPLSYGLANSLGDDYDSYNSFMNIAFGAGFGGTFGAGFGLLGDALGGDMRGVAAALPASERNAITLLAAHQLARDGDVNIAGLLDNAARTRLLSSVSDFSLDNKLRATLKSEGPVAVAMSKARQSFYKDIPEINSKIVELEAKIAAGNKYEGKTEYHYALEEYSAADVMATKQLNKKYGESYKREAEDYIVYEKKRSDLQATTDKRRIKTLEKELSKLESKYEGRFETAYKNREDAALALIDAKSELERIHSENEIGIRMKYNDMLDQAYKDYVRSKQEATVSYSPHQQQKIDRMHREAVDEIDRVVSGEDDIDADLASLKQVADANEARLGIETDKIDDAEFNSENIVNSIKNYVACLRR